MRKSIKKNISIYKPKYAKFCSICRSWEGYLRNRIQSDHNHIVKMHPPRLGYKSYQTGLVINIHIKCIMNFPEKKIKYLNNSFINVDSDQSTICTYCNQDLNSGFSIGGTLFSLHYECAKKLKDEIKTITAKSREIISELI